MRRACDMCGRDYEAKRSDSRTCGSTCRNNKARGADRVGPVDSPLVRATHAELEAAGKLNTRHGQQALVLAARMSTGTGVGPLSKELDRVMAAAIGFTPVATPAPGAGDDVDELRARRDAKRAG